MKTKLAYIERKLLDFVSIERVFGRIAESLPEDDYEIETVKLPFGSGVSGIVRNLFSFKKPDADIYHVTGHVHFIVLALPYERTVLTIHDLRILHTSRGLRRFLLKKLFLDWPLKRAKHVTAISEATRDDIVAISGFPKDRIRVIENPLTIDVKAGSKKREFNTECPTILQVGTEPHKNLENLIPALEGIPSRLEIVGNPDERQTALLKRHRVDYSVSSDLNDSEMLQKYLHADIVAFCSTFEGFGLPIIEAQATGTPVITSEIEPMKSVAGEGAFLVNPFKPNDIRTGIKRVIEDLEYRDDLVGMGLENVKRFEPSLIAAKYDELYQEILSERSS